MGRPPARSLSNLLAIDAGNTQIHCGVFKDGTLAGHWRTGTRSDATADELALTFGQLLGLGEISFRSEVSGIVVGSVVPPITRALKEMALLHLDLTPVMVGPGAKTGFSISIDNPKEVGADRIANAAAAGDLYGGPAIVVDFGTATTFDVVGENGAYLGGAICPGVQTSLAALARLAAQLPKIELAAPAAAIGKSTQESVRSGSILGAASMVDGMVERLSAELGGNPKVIATGGLAELVIDHCRTKAVLEPLLTLTGLKILYERNV